MVEAAAQAEGMALDASLLATEVPWPGAGKHSRVTDGLRLEIDGHLIPGSLRVSRGVDAPAT
jgi:hypothetical protein